MVWYLIFYISSRGIMYVNKTLSAHHYFSDINQEISTRWLAIQIEAVANFLIFFGAHMNILVTVRVYILFLLERSYRSPNYVEW